MIKKLMLFVTVPGDGIDQVIAYLKYEFFF